MLLREFLSEPDMESWVSYLWINFILYLQMHAYIFQMTQS